MKSTTLKETGWTIDVSVFVHAQKKENSRNSKRPITNTSGFKGVSWRKDRSRWYAHIKVNQKFISLGSFGTVEKAAKAYDNAAKKEFGKYARTNF